MDEDPDVLHAKTQLGYLLLKLKSDGILEQDELKQGLSTLFPDIIKTES